MQKISTHLKKMMKNADVTVPEAAECIGCSVGTNSETNYQKTDSL